ncbi:Glyoxalase-like domain protein [compost metagenome]
MPVLASLNLAETLQFYTRHLGFAPLLEMDNYLILQRDGCELHFWPCNERRIAENTSCYVRADTGVLHADFAARGLQVAPPVIQPWGMKEMFVIDPHGNLLKFGEPA